MPGMFFLDAETTYSAAVVVLLCVYRLLRWYRIALATEL
jgi:hypothetical protein